MTLGIVIALLLLGILLLLVEILFVPGTTVVGIGGVILMGIGIFLAYEYLGTGTGHMALGSSVAAVFLALVVLLKTGTWKKMALDTNVEGKSSEQMDTLVQLGQKGKTISRLNPIGKAMFGDRILEVTTNGEFAEEGTDIEVIKVEQNRIRVKVVRG